MGEAHFEIAAAKQSAQSLGGIEIVIDNEDARAGAIGDRGRGRFADGRGGGRIRGGEPDGKCAAAAGAFGPGGNGAAVKLAQGPHDGEPDAETAL
jgi:hypothetical protein